MSDTIPSLSVATPPQLRLSATVRGNTMEIGSINGPAFKAIVGDSVALLNPVPVPAPSLKGTTNAVTLVVNLPPQPVLNAFVGGGGGGGTSPVPDGTYTVGLGVSSDGKLTFLGGVITNVQEATV